VTGLLLLTATLVAAPPAAPHFDTEVVPVLTRAGCNAGACHGAAAGRGGFHLSLFGADPAADHEAIVHAFEGRRVNLARPGESLVLAKPARRLPHGGGRALPADSPGADVLARWIAAGAPRDGPRKLTDFQVTVGREVVEDDRPVAIHAAARFNGGPEVDVTRWTVFTAADPTAVEMDEGKMTVAVRRRGRHVVIARFLDRVEPVRLTRPVGDGPVDLSCEQATNFIDEQVVRTLRVLRLPVSPQADDLAFLRRVRLDLTGTLPTPAELDAFRKNPSREALVDRLLRSEE
jgi:hypothetical protein